MSNSAANKIDADDRSLRDILQSKKYSIDFFQREYKWQRKHIEQLLIDIEEAFIESYKFGDKIQDVSGYNSYFMGPVIFYDKSGICSIIDGQQRLTSLTLILIYIHNLQRDNEYAEPIADLIFSRKHGRTTFNLEVPERYDILDKLFNGKEDEIDISNEKNLSIINTYERYQDIKELFPEHLKNEKISLFIDWLKEKLVFVEIIAYSDKNAYTIFETMNDRGYNLTPSEMLKGLLLSKIENENYLNELNNIWREKISELHYYSVDEDLEFFRAWLRGQYADTMKKSTAAGTVREDFEKIGTSFHRWVKENTTKLKLKSEEDYFYFVKGDFVFYTDLYLKIKLLERLPTENLELINYLSNYSIATSLSYPLYISPIRKMDSEDLIEKKLLIIANFIERYIVIRSIQGLPISQTSIRYSLFNNVIKETRDLEQAELKTFLNNSLDYNSAFSEIRSLNVYNFNRKFLRYFFARITQYLSSLCEIEIDFYDLMSARRKTGTVLTTIFDYEIIIDNFDTNEEKNIDEFYFNLVNSVLKRKDLDDEVDEMEHNLYYRLFSTGNLTESEKIILSKKYTLPQTYRISKQWITERTNLLIEICSDIWKPIE